eukprot:570842-Pelagomonas_calceolata.AAC.1
MLDRGRSALSFLNFWFQHLQYLVAGTPNPFRHAVEDKVPIVERSPDAGPGLVESAQGLQEASPTIDWVLSKADAAVKR